MARAATAAARTRWRVTKSKSPQAQRPAAGGRLAAGDAAIEAKDLAADRGAGASRRAQQQVDEQSAAPAVADPAEVQATAQMKPMALDERPAGAAPRVAVTAELHKRQAVAAGKAVGVTVGAGGTPPPEVIDVADETPAASDGGYQLVVNRRHGARRGPRRRSRRRIGGTGGPAEGAKGREGGRGQPL
eukprot:2371251-Prymnesium_polylepis.1